MANRSESKAALPSMEKCKQAILTSLTDLGGAAVRAEIVERARASPSFSAAEREVPPPPSHPNYETYLDYRLSWALTQGKTDGVLENPRRRVWRLLES